MSMFLETTNALKKSVRIQKKTLDKPSLINNRENIQSALDNNQYTSEAFFDFQKAFNTVNHWILFQN